MYLLLCGTETEARGWGGGTGEVSSVHIQSTQPTQIFLSSVIPAARQLACTCLLPAAVTTPSALNSTITLASVTEFKAAVWQDRLANPSLLLGKNPITVILLPTRELMSGNAHRANKQQLSDIQI